MARKTRRRYRRKGRWSANLMRIANNTISLASGEFYVSQTLATNPSQATNTVSQQYTVKNFELSFTLDLDATVSINGQYLEGIVFYIMFVPQGYTINANLPLNHPEWIMANKFMGSIDMEGESNQQLGTVYVAPKRGPYRIRTRLSRRLQTGDSVILLITGNNGTSTIAAQFSGLLRWWTKAN